MAAVTDSYASVEDYRAYFKGIDGTNDPRVQAALDTASRYIDSVAGGRFFTKDAAVVARSFYPPYAGRSLYVDDIASTSGLVIKSDVNIDGTFETTFASTDYQLKPLTAAAGPEPTPWNCIYIPYWSTQALFVPQVPIQVTALWGHPSMPARVKTACMEIAAILLLTSARATTRIDSMGVVMTPNAQARSIVMELITPYSRVEF